MAIRFLTSKQDGPFSPKIGNEGMHHGSLLANRIISRCMQISEFLIAKHRSYSFYTEVVVDSTQLLAAGVYHYFDFAEGTNRCSHLNCTAITNEVTHIQNNSLQTSFAHGVFHVSAYSGEAAQVNAQIHVIRDGQIVYNFTIGRDIEALKADFVVVPFGFRFLQGDQIKVCVYPYNGRCKITKAGFMLTVDHIANNPFNTPKIEGGLE